MSFMRPPAYDDDQERWTDFVGETVVLEPVTKVLKVGTKYGEHDAWDCIVWVLGENDLVPHPGIRIFNGRIISQLDAAKRVGAVIPGVVTRFGNNTRLAEVTPEMQEYLLTYYGHLWSNDQAKPAVAEPESESETASEPPF